MHGGAGFSRLLAASGAAAVRFGQAVSVAILLATALSVAWSASHGLAPLSAVSLLLMLPYAGCVVAGRRLRQALRDGADRPWAHAGFFACTAAAGLASIGWFRDPMHDIALLWGGHGRWGCETLADDGSAFLLRDSTVPWLIFVPILLATAAQGIASWKSSSDAEG